MPYFPPCKDYMTSEMDDNVESKVLLSYNYSVTELLMLFLLDPLVFPFSLHAICPLLKQVIA